ncbi:hypothetical protein PUMCH_003275 [Australozyma saopauloensis]|uniref:Cysteine protease RIM13 n=1 Tax=Australozyma saopauloensis TaxID=291208 RepID=A0AAX4HBL6_9ASCO|nr:hypothetical protein PUMCH_003275 [[Candida] saopauloensis]
MDAKELAAQCCWNLQLSHFQLARNDLGKAKKHCLRASMSINEALRVKTDFLASLVAEIAKFTLEYHKKLMKDGSLCLLALEKLQWLASTNSDRDWFPILQFDTIDSTAVMPVNTVDDNMLKLPKLSSDFAVEFNETVARLSIERQLSAIKIDHSNRNIKPGTLALSDLYQDLLTNCSFVLSLLSIAELGKELDLRSLVTFHGNSKAKVELYFNGARREIPITTSLPFVLPPHEARSLHVRSLSSETLTWPAILEKAFLIALGEDYTFSGSNMAQDTYVLIGWIPEIRKTSNSRLEEIAEYFKLKEQGLVALGLGTGPMSMELAKQLEVVPEHDYVLSHYDDVEKVLILRNPWSATTMSENSMQQYLRVDLSLLGQFSYLYVNWNPNSYQSDRVIFPCVPLDWSEMFLADKPQYFFTNESDEPQEMIILVEKFFRIKGKLCVSIWEGTKSLIYTTTQYPLVEGGSSSDLRLQSLRFTTKPRKSYVISISSYHHKLVICSLTVFHKNNSLQLKKAKPDLPKKSETLTGYWNGMSRGGRWTCETYINNPQYDLKISSPNTSVAILLAAKNPTTEISVHMFHCEDSDVGRKIRGFDKSKLLVNENYSRLICLLSISQLDPGHYRIVASTYEYGETEEFRIMLAHDCDEDIQLTQVPQALGMFEQNLNFEWNGGNRTKFIVRTDYSNTKVTFQLLAGSDLLCLGAYIPAVRASLFDSASGKPVVLTSDWNDSIYGVFLDCDIPEKNVNYILLVERFEPGEGICRINVGSTSRLKIAESR